MNQTLTIGFTIELIGALTMIISALITMIKWNQRFLLLLIVGFVLFCVGFFITLN